MIPAFHWSDLSDNPNDPAVVRSRQAVLDRSRRPPVNDRLDLLRSLAAGRKVLDVGVVEHFVGNESRHGWLHRNLVEVAASCRGVDILADDVETLVAQGYDVVVHDLTTAPLPDQFDLVVMGEVIEHLGAPEAFLDNVRQMLRPDGRVVLTTPNPYMLHRAWHSIRGLYPDSVDHVVLLGPGNILELAARSGLTLERWRGVQLKDLPGGRNKAASLLRRTMIALGCAAELACDTLIYELVLEPSAPSA